MSYAVKNIILCFSKFVIALAEHRLRTYILANNNNIMMFFIRHERMFVFMYLHRFPENDLVDLDGLNYVCSSRSIGLIVLDILLLSIPKWCHIMYIFLWREVYRTEKKERIFDTMIFFYISSGFTTFCETIEIILIIIEKDLLNFKIYRLYN